MRWIQAQLPAARHLDYRPANVPSAVRGPPAGVHEWTDAVGLETLASVIVSEHDAESTLVEALGRRVSVWPQIQSLIGDTGISVAEVKNAGSGKETWASVLEVARCSDPGILDALLTKIAHVKQDDSTIVLAIRGFRRSRSYVSVRVECEILRRHISALMRGRPSSDSVTELRETLVRLAELAIAAREPQRAGVPVGPADLDLDPSESGLLEDRVGDGLTSLENYLEAQRITDVLPATPRTRFTPDHVASLLELSERTVAYRRALREQLELVTALWHGISAQS